MNGSGFIMEGVEQFRQVLAEFPEKTYRKPISKAMKAAAVPVRTDMANSLPSSIRKTKKILKVKASRQGLVVTTGFTGGLGMYENRRGQLFDPYQLVYWFAYGTLANRLSSHSFKNPRKRKSAAWSGGVMPSNFVEASWERSQKAAEKVFEETFQKEIQKMVDSYGVK